MEGATNKVYRTSQGKLAVRHYHGTYMIVDVTTGMNEGWVKGDARKNGWKLLGEAPDGVAGGAKSTITPNNLTILRELANK